MVEDDSGSSSGLSDAQDRPASPQDDYNNVELALTDFVLMLDVLYKQVGAKLSQIFIGFHM